MSSANSATSTPEFTGYYIRACLEFDGEVTSVNDPDEFVILLGTDGFDAQEKDMFWSVYGVEPDGCSLCLSDHETKAEAERALDALQALPLSKKASQAAVYAGLIVGNLVNFKPDSGQPPVVQPEQMYQMLNICKALGDILAEKIDIAERPGAAMSAADFLSDALASYASIDRLDDFDVKIIGLAACMHGYYAVANAGVDAAVASDIPSASLIGDLMNDLKSRGFHDSDAGLAATYFYSFQREAGSTFGYEDFAVDSLNNIANSIGDIGRSGELTLPCLMDDASRLCSELGDKFDLYRAEYYPAFPGR